MTTTPVLLSSIASVVSSKMYEGHKSTTLKLTIGLRATVTSTFCVLNTNCVS
eukprot:CAMPEP_0175615984 /NCGR_PEP_ID=MMETSP0096-20121207/65648_1 /TAXON_ID=311494 /ORGANISM="Alexandrium monilatum, Strain CCMP3105" /LENGTH=51 /DNA_ID=CAMNT_0016921133 /DNA_START=49 /DNA_END=201 /DNA_ORIENTATION=-